MKHFPDNFLLEMCNALNYGETKPEKVQHQSSPQGEVVPGSGPLVPFGHTLSEQLSRSGHRDHLANTHHGFY